MKIQTNRELTPATSQVSGPDNYCWWNGEYSTEPHESAGYVFRDKATFARQVYADYPDRLPEPIISGSVYTHGLGCVVGGDGFGWVKLDKLERFWTRFPHIAGVTFGDNVELGSNVTIDRGVLEDTYIDNGVKIDNGVHVGHNVLIGRNTRIAAHAIIGGGAIIGADCWIGLGAIIKEHVTVGRGATIGMGAIILEDVPAGETWVGNPAHKLR